MSLKDIKSTDPKTAPADIAVYAAALDMWADDLNDASVEFSLTGLKLFENVNGFFPGGRPGSEDSMQFLTDLNDFILSWPSADEIAAADDINDAKAAIQQLALQILEASNA